ncbi:hypothetical protein HZY86_07800 [Aerococcaceae bacterium DSM 111020]|nr:hypothetical protein [Aerococcaceae bacterium DSM 111020]
MIRKIVLLVFILSGLGSSLSISANEEAPYPTYHQVMELGFNKIQQLENFQIDFEMMDVNQERTLYQGTFYGNQDTGNLEMKIDFFENIGTDEEPDFKTHPFHLYAYDHFYLVYNNQIQSLLSLGIADLPLITDETGQLLKENTQTMTAIGSDTLTERHTPMNYLTALLMLPNFEKINEIPAEFIDYHQGQYQVSMERVEIPEGLFQQAGNFKMGYLTQVKFERLNDPERIQMNVLPEFTVQKPQRGVDINLGTSSNINQLLQNYDVPSTEQDQTSEIDELDYQFRVNSRDVTEKLTKAEWTLVPSEHYYQVKLTGIAEKVNLNFFDTNTAKLNSANLQLTMTLKPTDYQIPPVETLDTLSQKELIYFINQSLQQKRLSEDTE